MAYNSVRPYNNDLAYNSDAGDVRGSQPAITHRYHPLDTGERPPPPRPRPSYFTISVVYDRRRFAILDAPADLNPVGKYASVVHVGTRAVVAFVQVADFDGRVVTLAEYPASPILAGNLVRFTAVKLSSRPAREPDLSGIVLPVPMAESRPARKRKRLARRKPKAVDRFAAIRELEEAMLLSGEGDAILLGF